MVQNKLITLDEELSQDDLHRVSNYLNHEFANQPLREIRRQVLERMQEEMAQYDILVRQAMDVGEKTFADTVENESDIYLGGTVNILDQPEFTSNVEQMKDLFAAFEEKSRLISVLDKCLEETRRERRHRLGNPPSRTFTSAASSPTPTPTPTARSASSASSVRNAWPIPASWPLLITPPNWSARS